MAFSTNGGGYGGGFGARRRGAAALSEINVTPFVDVVLVLLIIFMLTAQVMEFGLEIDVPKVRAVKESAQELPVVNVTKDGLTYLNKDLVNINQLNRAILQRFGKTKAVYVRADKDTVFNVVAQVLAELGQGGFQMNVVTQPEDSSSQRRK
ncbi:MAG TPA: biopolymer transporter ExbD [Bryobacteraceae bacterium]|jgi:biopolymer transport protein ExbD|nr:biopolymer transporter ExbD [Bryobacteraceae bacterium]